MKSLLSIFIFFCLLLISCSNSSTEPENSKITIQSGSNVVLYETFPEQYVFSFSQGKILLNTGWKFSHVNTYGDTINVPLTGDLWWDDESMLVRNAESFVDMGVIALDDISEAPTSGYQIFSIKAIVNHAYCVITADGKYAKIKIIEIGEDATDDYIKFNWVYQSDGSRKF